MEIGLVEDDEGLRSPLFDRSEVTLEAPRVQAAERDGVLRVRRGEGGDDRDAIDVGDDELSTAALADRSSGQLGSPWEHVLDHRWGVVGLRADRDPISNRRLGLLCGDVLFGPAFPGEHRAPSELDTGDVPFSPVLSGHARGDQIRREPIHLLFEEGRKTEASQGGVQRLQLLNAQGAAVNR